MGHPFYHSKYQWDAVLRVAECGVVLRITGGRAPSKMHKDIAGRVERLCVIAGPIVNPKLEQYHCSERHQGTQRAAHDVRVIVFGMTCDG